MTELLILFNPDLDRMFTHKKWIKCSCFFAHLMRENNTWPLTVYSWNIHNIRTENYSHYLPSQSVFLTVFPPPSYHLVRTATSWSEPDLIVMGFFYYSSTRGRENMSTSNRITDYRISTISKLIKKLVTFLNAWSSLMVCDINCLCLDLSLWRAERTSKIENPDFIE